MMQLIRPTCPVTIHPHPDCLRVTPNPTAADSFFQVQEISNRLLSSYDINLDEFFSEIDSSIAASRDVFQQLEEIVISETDWEKIQIQVGLGFFICF